MARRRWENVSVGSLTETERGQLRDALGVVPRSQFTSLKSSIGSTGLALLSLENPAASITAPTGGGTIDTQARTAINAIITALRDVGIIEA